VYPLIALDVDIQEPTNDKSWLPLDVVVGVEETSPSR